MLPEKRIECKLLRKNLQKARRRLRLAPVVIGITFIFTSLQSPSHAEEDRTATALKMIGDFASQICQTAPVERKETDIELSGDAKAKVGGVLNKLADLGLQGNGKYKDQTNSNILIEKDLIIAIQGGNNCKLDVFHSLERDLLNKPSAIIDNKTVSLPVDYSIPNQDVYCKRLVSVVESVRNKFKGLLGPSFGSDSWTANTRLPSARWCVVNTFPGFGGQAPHKYYSCMLHQNEINPENMKIRFSSYVKSTGSCLGQNWSGSEIDPNYDISDAEVTFSKDDGGPTIQLRTSGNKDMSTDLVVYVQPPS